MNRIPFHGVLSGVARSRKARPGHHRLLVVAAAAVAFAVAAGVAEAAIVNPPGGGHGVLVFPVRDFVTGTGYTAGQKVTVDVVRNGVVIGTSNATADSTGTVLVNHPGGDCWLNTTPDILAGDVVQLLTDPVTPVGDATTTANVVITQPATAVAGTVTVKGTAQDAAGNPLPFGELQQRMISKTLFNVNGRRDLRAPGDGTLAFDAPGSINWTATYTGLSAADIAIITAAESRMLWLGPTPLLVNQSTLYEFGQIPGPTPPCTSPLAATAITNVSRSVVNSANVGTDLVVSGVVQSAAISVVVTTPAGIANAAVFTPGPAGTATWTATVPAGQLAALPEGAFSVTATFTGLGAPGPAVRVLTKDTVAPAAPTATPAPGTFPAAQAVTLSDTDATAEIHYTVDGTTPTGASPISTGQLQVTATQTIQALAIDRAGNAGPIASFSFTIASPAPQAPAPPVATPAVATPPAAAPVVQQTPAPTQAKKFVVALAPGQPRSLHALRSGKVAIVTAQVAIDQTATLAVSAIDGRARKQLALLFGTRVGTTVGQGATISYTAARAGIVKLTLRISASRLKTGRSYLIIVNGHTASGVSSRLMIPFTA